MCQKCLVLRIPLLINITLLLRVPPLLGNMKRPEQESFRLSGKLAVRGYKMKKKGMICSWCTEHRKALETQNVLTSSKFIDGCTSYKAESIAYHEKSAAHALAAQCHRAQLHPEKNAGISSETTTAQAALC